VWPRGIDSVSGQRHLCEIIEIICQSSGKPRRPKENSALTLHAFRYCCRVLFPHLWGLFSARGCITLESYCSSAVACHGVQSNLISRKVLSAWTMAFRSVRVSDFRNPLRISALISVARNSTRRHRRPSRRLSRDRRIRIAAGLGAASRSVIPQPPPAPYAHFDGSAPVALSRATMNIARATGAPVDQSTSSAKTSRSAQPKASAYSRPPSTRCPCERGGVPQAFSEPARHRDGPIPEAVLFLKLPFPARDRRDFL
jgi:hypothetical protein